MHVERFGRVQPSGQLSKMPAYVRIVLLQTTREVTAVIQLDQLDRSDDRSPYLQIAAALREAINVGLLGPGDRLPSESELTGFYGVARMTVRQAVQELKSEGLVTAEHGRGVFVRSAPVVVRRLASERFARRHRDQGKAAFLAEAEQVGYSAGVDRIEVSEGPAAPDVAERLGIAAGDPVIVRARRYLADGEPVETATSYIPAQFARGTAITETHTGPGGIYARLEDNGHPLARFIEEIGARMPTPTERRALRLATGVPVLTVVRTAFDDHDVAVEVCDTVKASTAYVLECEFPAR
jgi:GntR family transcriptional regulator